VAGGSYVYRDTIKDLLQWFISVVDDFGPGAPFVYTWAAPHVQPALLDIHFLMLHGVGNCLRVRRLAQHL